MTDPKLLEAPVVDLRAELVLLKGAQAPVIFFEGVGAIGVRNYVGNMTLEIGIHVPDDAGVIMNRRHVVAHIRFPLAAIPNIRASLDAIELAAKPPASEERN
ncbi:MAG: hypothetical protein ACLGSH_01760 [Acidobacteriota bacterium]